MKLLLTLSEIPVWAWIVAAAIIVVAIVAIVFIILWAKKPSEKTGAAKTASRKSDEKPEDKPVEKQQKPEEKPQSKAEEKPEPLKPAAKPAKKEEPERNANSIPKDDKVYHVSKRKQDGKWQVKAAGGAKAIKLFDTQKEAIDYARRLAGNQEARVVIHKVDGSFRKDAY